MKGAANLEYDWAAVSAMAAPFLPADLEMQGQRSDSISFESVYPTAQAELLLPNLNTEVKLGFTKADYMGMAFGPTELEIQIKSGLLEIKPFSTEVNNGRLNFAAKTDFNQKPALLEITEPMQVIDNVQINKEMTGKLLMYLNPIFANVADVNGVANFNCERLSLPLAEGAQNDIELIGTVSLSTRLQQSGLLAQIFTAVGKDFNNQVITIHPTEFAIQEGLLKYDKMQMDIGGYPVNFENATIGLDKSLDMKVVLPDEGIKLSLGGTVDKPELDLGKLLGDQVEQLLRDELRKGLEGLFK